MSIGQKLILPGSNPKKSMFYLVHRYQLIETQSRFIWELLARKVYSEEMQFKTEEQLNTVVRGGPFNLTNNN